MKTITDLKIENISQIYLGDDRACRCGCVGNYIASTYMKEPRSEVNNSLIQRRLSKALRLIEKEKAEVEYGSNHINVSYGKNKAITIYTDELKD